MSDPSEDFGNNCQFCGELPESECWCDAATAVADLRAKLKTARAEGYREGLEAARKRVRDCGHSNPDRVFSSHNGAVDACLDCGGFCWHDGEWHCAALPEEP